MYSSIFLAAGLLGLASAYTQPTNATWGALLTPNAGSGVTQGQTYKVTWDSSQHATAGVTVSLVLCKGDSSNCVNQPDAIASGLAAAANSYDWAVPCDLAPGVHNTATGYGMLIIVDQTGEFQYSTQFSVEANPACAGSTTTTTSSSSSSTGAASSQWGNWPANATTTHTKPTSAPSNYTVTTAKPTAGTTFHASTTPALTATPAVSTPAVASVFPGAASRIGGGAAAMFVAVGAAFFAL